MNVQHSGSSKSFAKDKRLQDEGCSGWPLEVDNKNWKPSSKLILLQLHEKLPKNSTSTILQLFFIWSKLERWKSLISGCLVSWLKIKNVVLKCHLPFILHNNEPFLNQIGTKSGFYTTGNDLLSGWTKKKVQSTSQSQTCTKKRSCSLFAVLLLVWSTTAVWIPVKPLHLRYMLSKSIRCTENCITYSWHRSTERAQFFSITMPDCMSHNPCFKSWMSCATKFCLIHHIHLTSCQPTTTSSSILTTFCRENGSTTSRMQKMLSKSSSNPEAQIFTLQE